MNWIIAPRIAVADVLALAAVWAAYDALGAPRAVAVAILAATILSVVRYLTGSDKCP